MKLILVAFMMSSTAAFAGCPPQVMRGVLKEMAKRGRQPQRAIVDCRGNGSGKGGHGTMLITVGGELVGSCSVDKTNPTGPKYNCAPSR